MNIRISLVAFLALCLSVGTTVALAASVDPEIDWIVSLTGVKTTTVAHKGATVNVVCAGIGSTSSLLGSIRTGLAKRGWTITPGSDVQALGASVTTIRAQKGGMLLAVSSQEVGVLKTLQLSLDKGGAPATPAPSGETGTEATPSTPPRAGPDVFIDDGNTEKTIPCTAGQRVLIRGGHNTITLTGECGTVEISGSHNEISVKARVEKISLLGSYNTVEWSKGANPTAPRVSDLGTENEVESVE